MSKLDKQQVQSLMKRIQSKSENNITNSVYVMIPNQELKPERYEIRVITVLDRPETDSVIGELPPFTLDWEMQTRAFSF